MPHLVSVYRSADGIDCTNHGISSLYAHLYVLEPNEPVPSLADRLQQSARGVGYARLVEGHSPKYARVIPILPSPIWTMFGGNLVSSSDASWIEAVQRITGRRDRTVDIHDRIE